MRDLKFARSTIDRCLFVRAFMRDGHRVVCLVLLYVDDVLFVGDCELSKEMSDAFCSYYKTTAGGDDYLGLEIAHDKLTGCVRITQTAFIKKLVSRFGLEKCAHAATPLPMGWTPFKAEVPTGGSERSYEINDVPSAVGMIGYLVSRTRPDANFAYGMMSQIAYPSVAMPDAPNAAHVSALVKILRWLSTTCNDGLTFRRAVGLSLRAAADSALGSEPATGSHGTCLARSGGFITLSGACIDSFSKCCRYAVLSTAEAEIYALLLLLRRLIYIRRILTMILGYTLPPTVIEEDNRAVVSMLQRRDLTSRSRHMRINIGFIIDAIDANEIRVVWVPSQAQVADMVAAAEDRARFMRNRLVVLGGI